MTLDAMRAGDFVVLGERPGRELALGVVGRFWTPTGQILPETRILCTDAASRRRFRRYWRVIRPFSGLIRIALLHAVAREVRRTPR